MESNLDELFEDRFGKILLKRKKDFIGKVGKFMSDCRKTLSDYFDKRPSGNKCSDFNKVIWRLANQILKKIKNPFLI
jgi:hypothetical protein